MAEAKKTPAAKAVEEPASKAAPAAKRPASRKAAPSAAAQPATTTPVMKKEKAYDPGRQSVMEIYSIWIFNLWNL